VYAGFKIWRFLKKIFNLKKDNHSEALFIAVIVI